MEENGGLNNSSIKGNISSELGHVQGGLAR